MLNSTKILSSFDPIAGTIPGVPGVKRHLSDLRGCFRNAAAYEKALTMGDPLLYSVTVVEPADGAGDLHCAIALIEPGRIADEYFMTRGHLHSWREAAEFYIGLRGEGVMLLEDEAGGESRMVPLRPDYIVYVPGKTAHRTMNTGPMPLTYLGVYPAKAGHDYDAIAGGNFRCVVVERDGQPAMLQRNKS
ncbi:MAG: glucose-6-phosphate isomerase family protein [Verrucomicrobiota bacterium]